MKKKNLTFAFFFSFRLSSLRAIEICKKSKDAVDDEKKNENESKLECDRVVMNEEEEKKDDDDDDGDNDNK